MIRAPHMPSPEVAEALRRDDADDLALVGTDVLIAWHHLPHAPVRYAVVAATPSGIVARSLHADQNASSAVASPVSDGSP